MLEVEATYRTLSYKVSSNVIDYVVFEGYSGNISLEKQVNNEWFEVRKRLSVMDASEFVSPKQSCSNEIRWKDYYGLNLEKAEYRLILTYWTSEFNDEVYNAVAYFVIS